MYAGNILALLEGTEPLCPNVEPVFSGIVAPCEKDLS